MSTTVQTDPSKAAHAPARVLVVDDERSMRELLSIVLRRDGYDVLIAEDGAAGLELLKRERIDILITDIRMPVMNGVDLLRQAKGIAPEELDGIFHPFRGGFEKGTGLGLAIVHRIVSDYGGEVHVTSQRGVGTRVDVTLPLTAPAADDARATLN